MLIKKRSNSNLNADQINFLTNKTVTLVLGLYVYNIVRINLRPKQNCLLFLEGTCQLEPAEIQNTKTSAAFLKRGESIEYEKLLLNTSDIKAFFQN